MCYTSARRWHRTAPGNHATARLESLRGELRAECISWGELNELQSLAAYIEPGDTELLEAAGVPEFPGRRGELIMSVHPDEMARMIADDDGMGCAITSAPEPWHWPAGKTFGQLSRTGRRIAIRRAATQMQDELTRNAAAITTVLEEGIS